MNSRLIVNVDDTEGARYAKRRTLLHAGYEVVDACNGAEGLAKVEELRPALVLLDVHLRARPPVPRRPSCRNAPAGTARRSSRRRPGFAP